MAVAYAQRSGTAAPVRGHARGATFAATTPRPTPSALLELHTLQALDAILAGASLRDVGEGLFGADAVADWYSDGGLRSKVRRLVRRGDALMRSEEHTSELQSLMRISYAVFCLQNKK